MPPKILAANLFEYALVGLGWLLAWRCYFSPKAKAQRSTPALARWNISPPEFALAGLYVGSSWIGAQVVAGILLKVFPLLKNDQPLFTIIGGSMAQLCLIGGTLAAVAYLRKTEPSANTSRPGTVRAALLPAAVITFVITISVVQPVQYLWENVLLQLHLPTDKQEMVEMFFRTASPFRLLGLTVMAVVLAPVAEELVFRAGLYRFLRGRIPHWAALLLPSLIFSLLHVDRTNFNGLITVAPLTALGMIFSLAYERTGRIAVPMLAHALFNLHTVMFLLLGIGE